MNRETRYNLVFLVVIVALLTPGAVILFRRKMQPTARPMYLPDPVPRAIAYMSRGEVPPGMGRTEPPRLREWKESIVAASALSGGMRPRDALGLPLMSRDKAFEVLAVVPEGERRGILVMLWNDPKGGAGWKVGTEDAMVTQSIHPMPPIVREELGETGVLAPPKEVVVQRLTYARDVGFPVRLRNTTDAAEIVQSFTNIAPASN